MSKQVQANINGKFDTFLIKTFTFEMFKQNNKSLPTLLFIAKRNSGKSWIVRALMYFFKDIPVGIIIAPTDKMTNFYGKFYPETFIYYKFKEDTLVKVLKRQQLILQKKKERHPHLDTRCIILMDDCMSEKTWVKSQSIAELLMNGRHYEIMYLLTMQYPLGITPEMRNNFDYVFVLKSDIVTVQKKIYDHYAGMFKKFSDFCEVFKILTDNFGTMVIKNLGAENDLLDKIYYYKAPNLENVLINMGCKQFRDYHKNNYDPTWATSKSLLQFDANNYFEEKRKTKGHTKIEIE